MTKFTFTLATASMIALAACGGTVSATNGASEQGSSNTLKKGAGGKPFTTAEVATFDEPWAMAFWPGTQSALVTEKGGTMKLVDTTNGQTKNVTGVPKVDYGGQGGLGDVVFAPGTGSDLSNATIYLSWAEAGQGDTRGAVIARGTINCAGASCAISDLTPVWTQNPKVTGRGHYSHRMAFSPDGKYLFLTSGDRQKMDPAQDANSDLGKVIRLDLATGKTERWTMGNRNLLGIAFDAAGNLWETEMGPQGGDEVNLIVQGKNYGWPKVSNGSHYGGEEIPDHAAGDGFEAPKVWWNPSISPSSLIVYSGDMFPQWKGDIFIGGLSGEALLRIDVDGTNATKGDQFAMGTRIREVEQGPDGAIWLLEDGEGGKLMKLTPVQ